MAEMEYRDIPGVRKKVSRIIYGTASDLFLTGGNANALLDAMLALGVNCLDTARNYQLSERSIGDWLEARGCRSQVVLLSKCGHPDEIHKKRVNEKAMREDFRQSSEYLRTDYIDIYLLHRDDPDTDVSVAVEVFNAMHAEGKIGAFGGSNWTHRRIEEANEYAYKHGLLPFSVSSPNFGLAHQVQDPWGGGCVSLSGEDQKEARAWYTANQMPVLAYSSLGRGMFSGRMTSEDEGRADEFLDEPARKGYCCPENFRRLARCEQLAKEKGVSVPQIAMAWIYRQPLNTFAIVSTSSAERMRENIEALHLPLSPEEVRFLDLQEDGHAQ